MQHTPIHGRAGLTPGVTARQGNLPWPLLSGLIATLALISAPQLRGQAAPATPAAAVTDSNTVVLSPFEVTAEQDESFTTNSVGTGSRLKLDLKDVPAAYSVINRQFIDALGINDLTEAATWAPGQTFFYNTNGGMAIFGEQGTYTSRGQNTAPGGSNVNFSSGNGSMRNFYSNSTASTDSYMVETYDFGRGPNSSLFGTSQAATGAVNAGAGFTGVNSSTTKRARFDAARTKIQLELGSWNYNRQAVDYNLPISDRVGLRINLVNSRTPDFISHNLRTSRGLHITTTWRIGDRTNLTIEGSIDKATTHSNGITITENFSGWDGTTVVRGPVTNTIVGGAATDPNPGDYGTIQVLGTNGPLSGNNGTFNGVDRISGGRGGGYALYWDSQDGTIMTYNNFATTRRTDTGNNSGYVPLWSDSGNNVAPNGQRYYIRNTGGRGPNNQFVSFNASQGGGRSGSPTWWNLNGLPDDMFATFIAGSRHTGMPGIRENWQSANWPQNTERARDLQFVLTHSVSDNLFLELGGDVNRIHAANRKDSSSPSLDINMIRPDGSPNPHFLDTYIVADVRNEQQWTSEQTIRGNAAYTLDAGRWGNYTFNLNGNLQYRHYDADTPGWILPIPGYDLRLARSTARVKQVHWYHGSRDYVSPEGKVLRWTDVDFGAAGGPAISTQDIRPIEVLRTGQGEAVTDYWTQYVLLQGQATWLDGKIVGLASVRRDYAKNVRRSDLNNNRLPEDWNGSDHFYRPTWGGIETASTYQTTSTANPIDYYQLTYQPLNNAGAPVGARQLAVSVPQVNHPTVSGLQIADPKYTGVAPAGYTGYIASPSEVQYFRNDFNPPAARTYANTYSVGATFRPVEWFAPFVNFSNQTIPPTFAEIDLRNNLKELVTAKGVDFGARFDFGNKFNFKYNYFINERENEATSNQVINRINSLIGYDHWSVVADGDPSYREHNLVSLPGNPDYQSTKNVGYEIEIGGTPMPGLRISLNGSVSIRLTDNADRYPLTRGYLDDPSVLSTLQFLVEHAGGSIDTSQKPLDDDNQPINQAPGLAVEVPVAGAMIGHHTDDAVDAYNDMWLQYVNIIDDTRSTRQPSSKSANLYADYTVQSGLLQGLRIGAGLQWQGDRNVGHRGNDTILNPLDPTVAIDDPLYDNQSIVWDMGAYRSQVNLAYPWRLENGNTLNLSLRIDNPLNDTDFLASWGSRQPDGDLSLPNRRLMKVGAADIPKPIQYRLTVAYEFGGTGRFF